jgi:hypothetical protein
MEHRPTVKFTQKFVPEDLKGRVDDSAQMGDNIKMDLKNM